MKIRIFGVICLVLIMTNFLPTIGTEMKDYGNEISAILKPQADPIIADHTVVDYVRFDMIPDENITNTKNDLHIAYQHTSHGSQITSGMTGLPAFKEGLGGTDGLYDYNNGGTDGALDLHDYFSSGDLGNPDYTTWADLTEDYLDNPANSDVNVIIWSWCGEVSYSDNDINVYLTLMNQLEIDYPDVTFVYMTGHVDGDGLDSITHSNNEAIRDYVKNNGKVLFDFADIESYDPDGEYYGDKNVTDGCCYDYDGDNITEYTGDPETPLDGDRNWAQDWQDTHTEGTDWYDCSSAHSEPLNANMKAYAIWWLWATLAGYDTPEATPTPTPTQTPTPTPTPTPTETPTTPTDNTSLPEGLLYPLFIVGIISVMFTIINNRKNKR